jgi:hypothetical protein
MLKRFKIAAAVACTLAWTAPAVAQQKVTYTVAGEGVYYILHYIAQ